jgi:hypothetical protein
MNLLQTFMAEAAAQASPITEEEFTIVGEAGSPVRLGTFGDPQLMPVMTRVGYQDYLTTRLHARATQWVSPAKPSPRVELVRTQTGQTFFVQIVDSNDPVMWTFILTDRDVQ